MRGTKTRALITGVSGQDGSYLAELLLDKGYDVVGLTRSRQPERLWRIAHLLDRLTLVTLDQADPLAVSRAITDMRPQEVYNLAAVTSIGEAQAQPALTADLNAHAVTRALETIRLVDSSIRFCQASSAELFGNPAEVPQRETTPFRPHSPYGIAKLEAHNSVVEYRQRHGVFGASVILFNHESPRRSLDFVSRKISDSVARIKLGLMDEVSLGSLDARRDWGFAGDYVAAMWLMLQQATPEDFVIATGISHSVQELIEIAFGYVGLVWQQHVRVDPAFARATEPHIRLGDSSRARQELGWIPTVEFPALVRMMVDADLKRVANATRRR